MNVAVIGLGYIGLPTAAMLADAGHSVTGVDVDERRLRDIRDGCAHLTESDVRAFVRTALESGRLRVSAQLPAAADAYVICVPTPSRHRAPDLQYVEQAAHAVAAHAQEGALVILESTVPPGTLEHVVAGAIRNAGKAPERFFLAHCPERVIPGATLRELRENARVIGGLKPEDAEMARRLYGSFCTGEICTTDAFTAELVKVVENTFRDVNLAFANELAALAESLGVDAWEVIRLANKHPRVEILKPGPGVGGHCIPVDPTFLSSADPFLTELIQSARRVNDRMPYVVARLIQESIAPCRSGGRIALLGAAYKAEVGDTRESPALPLAHLLVERGHSVSVYDPYAAQFEFPLAPTIDDALRDADALAVITDHRVFQRLDPLAAASSMKRRIAIDTRHILDASAWQAAGFTVRVLGAAPRDSGVQTALSA